MPDMNKHNPLLSSSASAEINGKNTDVMCASFADRDFVVVTQCKKLGTLVVVNLDQPQHKPFSPPTFHTSVIMGQDEPVLHVYARAIAETVHNLYEKNAEGLQGPRWKSLLCTLAISEYNPQILSEVCCLVKSCNLLDRAVYGPFKRYYNSACDCWMKENRGTTITIYDIPDMVGRSFPRAFTPVNIKICKCLINASKSDSDKAPPPLLSDEEDCSDGSTTDDEEMTEVNQPNDIKEGEFALVKFSARKSVQYYVGNVSDVFEDGDVTFKFLKRSNHFKLANERP
ncbi:unnamed protein product [Clavelina lepadiformis]|uniref:Proteasome assembly chaperone 1 n=1 Tax=Clavelina lepadiformis TaxID=159417 RepID=A0ABP0GK29_CLALP